MTSRNVSCFFGVIADLVDLSVAVYVADWLSPRKRLQHYNIHLQLPLRYPELFSQPDTQNQLKGLLKWYTQDDWSFEFTLRTKPIREIERSRALPYEPPKTETALWSGGLDSFLGLYERFVNNTAPYYTLFGTGSNDYIQGKQKKLVDELKKLLPSHQLKLIQLPIELRYPNERPLTNEWLRAKGFAFKLLGAMCAYLDGQKSLYIYENGIGAINLPFTLREIDLDHTRSVHPISLIKTGDFVSSVLGERFSFLNPFVYRTKSQMCNVLKRPNVQIDNVKELAFQTITCDSRYRQTEQPIQCGYCSSCLLRRQAFTASEIGDKTEYVITKGNIQNRQTHNSHLEAMLHQVKTLRTILKTPNPWRELIQRYDCFRQIAIDLSTQETVSEHVVQQKLLRLYENYVNEWGDAQEVLLEKIVPQST